jgi:hypothetical protein
MGWAWEQVPLQAACQVAYVRDPALAPNARLCIQADPRAWAQPAARQLQGLAQSAGLLHPVFAGQPALTELTSRAEGRVICQRDVIFDVFWLAAGLAERAGRRDAHGFFDLSDTPWQSARLLPQAPASHIRAWLERQLLDLEAAPPQPRWPQGKRAAVASGHDVDYPEVVRWLEPLRVLQRQGVRGLAPALDVLAGRRHHWQFRSWMDLEQALGLRSAFYFVPRQGSLVEYALGRPDSFYDVAAPRFQALLRMLVAEGWEVGLHASYHAYESWSRLAAEKARLEAACGRPVVGNRHHYWHLDPADPEATLRLHAQIGLEYDSSLIHNRYLGWRRGLAEPFYPFYPAERCELATLQVPIGWMDDQFFRFRADNPGDPATRLRELAQRVVELGGCFVVDVHEYVFDEALFPGWAALYRGICEYVAGRGDFWLATPAEIAAHWKARDHALRAASCGLELG